MSTLREQIANHTELEVRENYARHLEDWAETDTNVREIAKHIEAISS